MDDLIAFLHARLDEDGHTARSGDEWAVNDQRRLVTGPTRDEKAKYHLVAVTVEDTERAHIARHDPARVLRATEGLRGLLQRYEEPESSPDLPDSINRLTANIERQVLAVAFQYLALPYADHPDYRKEWRP